MSYVPAKVPLVGAVLGTILQMSTFGVLCFCLSMGGRSWGFYNLLTVFSAKNTVD